MIEFVLLRTRSQNDSLAVPLNALNEFAHPRERVCLRQILLFENLAASFFKLFAELVEFFSREENRQQLVAAFADLRADSGELDLLAVLFQSPLPRFGVPVHRVDECSVNVKDHGLNHVLISSNVAGAIHDSLLA